MFEIPRNPNPTQPTSSPLRRSWSTQPPSPFLFIPTRLASMYIELSYFIPLHATPRLYRLLSRLLVSFAFVHLLPTCLPYGPFHSLSSSTPRPFVLLGLLGGALSVARRWQGGLLSGLKTLPLTLAFLLVPTYLRPRLDPTQPNSDTYLLYSSYLPAFALSYFTCLQKYP